MIAKGDGVSFRSDENDLKLTAVMAAHICDYAKNFTLYTLNG